MDKIMFPENIVGFLEADAKKILKEKGLNVSPIYYSYINHKYYKKTNYYRVIRQKKRETTIQLILAPQCALSQKGGGEDGS